MTFVSLINAILRNILTVLFTITFFWWLAVPDSL